jgi:hypothetical protein
MKSEIRNEWKSEMEMVEGGECEISGYWKW